MSIRIAFLTSHPDLPSTRYRVARLVPHLKEAGFECMVQRIPKNAFKRLHLFSSMGDFDLVFLQKRLLSYVWQRLLRRFAKRIIFDYDDAIMFRDDADASRGHALSSSRMRKFKGTLKIADYLTPANTFLGEQALAAGFETPEGIHVLPTGLDVERWQIKTAPADEHGTLTLGWMGTWNSLAYLRPIIPAIQEVQRRRPNIKIKLICDRFIDIPGVNQQNTLWNPATETKEILDFDIGLAPLQDTPFARGKAAFKILTCFAAGVPVVASPVGANLDVVIEGETGYLASTSAQWIDSIEKLAKNTTARMAMGRQCRKLVETRYTSQKIAKDLANLLKSMI